MTSLVESAKKAAATRAVKQHLLPHHRFIGIGSGSTVVYVVEAIVALGPDFYSPMTFIPTGSQSKGLIRAAGLRMVNLDERPIVKNEKTGELENVHLDVCFDGADEVDEELNLIKGGGACLLQEKLVAIAAKQFVCVADYRKQSPRLCTQWKTIPIEVLPLAAPDLLSRLRALGSPSPTIRSGLPSKAGECVTDNGMWIIDAPFSPLLLEKDLSGSDDGAGSDGKWEVSKLAAELVKLPGVVEIGLFHGVNGDEAAAAGKFIQAQKPVAVYFGMQDGEVQALLPSKA
ncbi:ribose 5-phosphate isomerase [Sarocladium strictum]